jgi:hypothetical protein
MCNEFWILTVLIIGGVLGGAVNRVLGKPDDTPPPSWARSILVGFAASFLVPLFLNMISSDLIKRPNGAGFADLLVLLGFSLVAAISSTAFIRTLSDRVLQEAKLAQREAAEAKAGVTNVQKTMQPIVDKETESDSLADEAKPLMAESQPQTDDMMLLKALTGGRWALRSQSGLAKETGIDPVATSQHLETLLAQGMVGRTTTRNGPRWFITEAGRERVHGGT